MSVSALCSREKRLSKRATGPFQILMKCGSRQRCLARSLISPKLPSRNQTKTILTTDGRGGQSTLVSIDDGVVMESNFGGSNSGTARMARDPISSWVEPTFHVSCSSNPFRLLHPPNLEWSFLSSPGEPLRVVLIIDEIGAGELFHFLHF